MVRLSGPGAAWAAKGSGRAGGLLGSEECSDLIKAQPGTEPIIRLSHQGDSSWGTEGNRVTFSFSEMQLVFLSQK